MDQIKIQPIAYFCTAPKLGMSFMFLDDWGKKVKIE